MYHPFTLYLLIFSLLLSAPALAGQGSWGEEVSPPLKKKRSPEATVPKHVAPTPAESPSVTPTTVVPPPPVVPEFNPALDRAVFEDLPVEKPVRTQTDLPKEPVHKLLPFSKGGGEGFRLRAKSPLGPLFQRGEHVALYGLLGIERIQGNRHSDIHIAGGLRIALTDEKGLPFRWSWEVWANPPHETSGNFQNADPTIQGTLYRTRVLSLAEWQLSAHYQLPHGAQNWIIPELGFGVSMAQVQSEVKVFSDTGTLLEVAPRARNTSFSPLFQMGVTLLAHQLVSLRFDAAYVSYANTFTSGNNLFDLGFSGWLLRPMAQVRIY